MTRTIVCTGCSTSYRIADTVKAKSASCKKCGASIAIPELVPELEEAAPAKSARVVDEPASRPERTYSSRAAEGVKSLSNRSLREKPRKPALNPVSISVALGALVCLYAAYYFGYGPGSVKPGPAPTKSASSQR